MKITDIEVDSFGHWKGLQIPGISPQITVIHGPNEAGKSTLLHLIRAVLYGFQAKHHARFVPPRYPGHTGGKLTVQATNGRFQVRRWLESTALTHDAAGELAVDSLNGGLSGRHLLPTLLAGVDDAIFRNVFAVGLSEMQQLGTLSDTEAAHQLYGLAAGSDRVSIADVSRYLADSRQKLLAENDPSSITTLLAKRDQLRHEIEHEQSLAPRWLKVFEEQRQVNAEIAKLEKQQKRFTPELSRDAGRQAVREQWKQCRQAHKKLVALGKVREIPADAVEKLDLFAKQIREHRKQWVKLRDKRRQLRDQARDLDGHPALMHYGDEIQQLHQRASWLNGLAKQVEQLKTKSEETEFELLEELEKLGLKTQWKTDSLPMITDEMIRELREPAREAREARETGEAADATEKEGQEAVEKIQRQLASTLEHAGYPDLTTAVQRLDNQIGLLDHRIKLQGKIEASERRIKDLRREHNDTAAQQLLPWRGLMMLGGVFALGGVLLMIALFDTFGPSTVDQRWRLGILGAIVSSSSLIIKAIVEFAAGRTANACRDELMSHRKKITGFFEDIQQIEGQLPPSTEPHAIRLQRAEDELARFRELQPLENQRVVALERVRLAQEQKENASRQQREARERWRQQLRHYGLPESMTPVQFRQLTQADSPIGKIRIRAIEAQQQLQTKEAELKEYETRLETIFERANMIPDSDRYDEQAGQLYKAWQKARENHQQRETLHRKWREASREQEKAAREAKRIRERRQQLVSNYGVADAQELKKLVEQRVAANKLRRRRDAMLKEIAQQLGGICSLAQLRKDLDKGSLESRLKAWEREHDQTASRLAKLHEQRGELGQQVKTVATQRQLQQKRLELSKIESQLARRTTDWQALAATSLALDNVRKSYEADRQPGTLAEASAYLKRLTNGKYQRIWTPFGESSLCVDDQHNRPVQVEHLSRGTREQVFLSLRLALAAAYSRRGAGLPLILDDVFVNFDAKRAQYAAETICEFAAAGHQVLVFTCHDHIRDVFHRLGVDLRELPNAQEIADHPEPVLSSPAYVEPVVAAPIGVEEPETIELDAALPDEGDADLDHELIYGAPEYDPGHGLPELVPAIVDVLEEEAELVPAPARVAKPRRVKRRPAKRQSPAVTPAPTYPVQMPTTVVA
ncbi:MAG: AAA family ATPase, partial [Planctomycetales bacterium]|nr:AAA family ATPase [Planctomycetales bacterium]